MMRRLRDALLGEFSGQPLSRPMRPNELRRDVVRDERLRRQMHRTEQTPNRPGLSLEGQRPRPVSLAATPVTSARPATRHLAALKTRSGLRQAWLLKEILGPPVALRDPYNGNNDQ